jgi:hypothetical protein
VTTREPRAESVLGSTDATDEKRLTGRDEETDESVDAMVSDIEETRGEMAGTLGEIGDRLDPGNLVEQAKENVREATVGRVEEAVETAGETARGLSEMVMETIRQNPIPAAVAGIGLAWLWKNRAGGANGSSEYRYRPAGYAGAYGGSTYYGGPPSAGGQTGATAEGVGRKAGRAAEGVGQTLSETAGTVGQAVGDVTGNVGQTAGEVVQRGQYAAREAGIQFREMLDSNPLALGVVALGAGAALGVMVPETQREQELLGDTGEKVMEAVQQKTSETMDKVDRVAQKAQKAVGEGAKSQGVPAR